MEFKYDGGGIAKGGTITLYIDGKKTGEGRVDQTEPFVFSADETLDVGNEFGSPVTPDYPTVKKFNGEVNWLRSTLTRTPRILITSSPRTTPAGRHGNPVNHKRARQPHRGLPGRVRYRFSPNYSPKVGLRQGFPGVALFGADHGNPEYAQDIVVATGFPHHPHRESPFGVNPLLSHYSWP